jgi:exodeoxyribonuclease VIII
MEFKEGTYEDLPYEEYDTIPAFRSHDLTTALRCPYTWKNKGPFEETPALIEGRVQHTVFMEHHNFDKEFIIEPKIDKRTKAGKEEYALFMEEVGNRRPISQALYDTCMERREVVSAYIPKPEDKVELTVCYIFHGQQFKSRFDWYDGQFVWDLKTCRDASPRGFISAVNNFNYHLQAALYVHAARSLGLPCEGFKFLAQEKAHPYPYAIYTMSDESLEYGLAKNEQALHKILESQKNENFAPFGLEGEQTIRLEDLR